MSESSCSSNSQSASEALELAQLLEIGLIDRFIDQFTNAAKKSTDDLGQLVCDINERLAQNEKKRRTSPRLELSEKVGSMPLRIDVVTPCRFVGQGWPMRRSIVFK